MMTRIDMTVGMRFRQRVAHAPFVVQLRTQLGLGAVTLSRLADAHCTTFVVVAIEERSEVGMCCQVVVVEDERDGQRYVIDTALMGPGLPADTFEVIGNPDAKG